MLCIWCVAAFLTAVRRSLVINIEVIEVIPLRGLRQLSSVNRARRGYNNLGFVPLLRVVLYCMPARQDASWGCRRRRGVRSTVRDGAAWRSFCS